MGKWKKKTNIRDVTLKEQKKSLAQQIEEDAVAKTKTRQKLKNRQSESEEYVDSTLSRKILSEARKQQKEIEDETSGIKDEQPTSSKRVSAVLHLEADLSDEDEMPEEGDGEVDYEAFEIDAETERDFNRFEFLRVTKDVIATNKAALISEVGSNASCTGIDLDPSVRAMYEGVRDILSRYRSGKLPKAFKVVPKLRNWEQILQVLEPEKWSSAAMYQATRIFASNLSDKMAQRFYNLVLLPRVRDDLAEYKRLNFHLTQALIKAIYKPSAFMKGIILPLLTSGNCTLREATIVGAIVAKSTIPVSYSAAAMAKIAEMDYTGANSIFLRIFFDKKYALPYQAIDAVVDHFLRFQFDKREMPVLWHQALLTFVQRYKSDISTDQKERLLELLKKQSHYMITPEIRRELQHAELRDIEMTDASMNE